MQNRQVVLVRAPDLTTPVSQLFECRDEPIANLEDGEVLVRVIYISVDPYMKQYSMADPSQVGKVMKSRGVGIVVQSRSSEFKAGDHVYGSLCWQTFAVIKSNETVYLADGTVQKATGADALRRVDRKQASLARYLGVLGTPGLTAYAGVKTIMNPKAGECVLVSGAAGAVGSVVIQLARLAGARVVGSAGSDAKVKYLMEQCGCDAAFNYKTVASFDEALEKYCPNGVDCYFDNVGGKMLDSVLSHANSFARVAVCGIISTLGPGNEHNMRNMSFVLTKQIKVEGFQARTHWNLMAGYIQQMSCWLREGDVRYTETVSDGLDSAPKALETMLAGGNVGKQLVAVSKDVSPPDTMAILTKPLLLWTLSLLGACAVLSRR
jgi:NADPH-dependent curcumin reductase CurA